MCDLGSDAPWDDVDRVLMERGVATFETDTRWFDHVCEDFGLLVLAPSGTSVDVVAETDSD